MSGEAGLTLERVTGWSKPQSSRLALPTWTWRWDDKQLADQRLPDGSDAGAELGSILQVPTVNVLGVYACDTASPLVSLVGGGPNLTAAGGPLTQRAANGLLHKGRRDSKLGCELFDGGIARFADVGNAFMDVADGTVRTFLLVARFNTGDVQANGRVVCKEAGNVWVLVSDPPTGSIILYGTAGYAQTATVVGAFTDGGWHCIIGVMDAVTAGNHQLRLYTDLGNNASALFAGSLNNAASFTLGAAGGAAAGFQCAYLACFDVALDATHLARFWTHGAKPAALTAYTRANTVRTACAASAVSAWSTNQYATRYAATFAARRNWRLEGVANDGPLTFQRIGADNLAVNTQDNVGNTHAAADGASGMQDGVRCTQGGAWAVGGSTNYLGPTPIVGASNVAWRGDGWYRRATTGSAAGLGILFTGDPGGAESFTLFTDAATPTRWTRGGGTCTPTRAAHTNEYLEYGAGALNTDVDWSELALVQGCAVAPDWWLLMGTVAPVTQNPAAITVSNAADAVLDHAQGSLRIRTAGYGGTDTWDTQPYLFCCAAGGGSAVGLIQVYRTAAAFLAQVFDNAGALVAAWNVAAAALRDGNDHLIQLDWCAATPVCYVGGVAWYAALYFDGALQAVGGGGTAPVAGWVPAVGGTIYINKLDPSFGFDLPGRAAIEEIAIFPNPTRLLGAMPAVL